MMSGIEQHVDWIAACIGYVRDHGYDFIEAQPDHERRWNAHVDEIAGMTLYSRGNSWSQGANVPGKVVGFMPYAGGGHAYRETVGKVVEGGYTGFTLGHAAEAERRSA